MSNYFLYVFTCPVCRKKSNGFCLNPACIEAMRPLPTLYARRERTTDSATFDMLKIGNDAERERFLRLRGHMDVQLYYDAACTIKAARYPWHYTKPTRRQKTVTHNCARYNLVWVEENPAG